MKVLHVIPGISARDGGPSQAIVPMCRALQQQGIEVTLATTDHGMVSSSEFRVSGSQSADAGSELGNQSQNENFESQTRNCYRGINTIFFPAQWGQSFKYSWPFAKWLNEHVAEFDVVHIHAVFNHACIAAARACRKKGVPYIVRPLGTLDPWGMSQKSWRKKVFLYAGVNRMLSEAAAIHYTSNGEQTAVEESLKLNHGIVIPLGVDAAEPTSGFLSNLPALDGHPYVLVLSRLLPTKGLDALLDAFLGLLERDEFQPWCLVFAGDGPDAYVARLKEKVTEQLASDFVIFTGWLDGERKAGALSNASLLALPSHHENFGLCVMEALACGVPVLISPHVSLATEVEAAGAGWITPVEKAAIQIALASALASDDERERRGLAGKALSSSFNWDMVATKLNTLYLSIVESRLRA